MVPRLPNARMAPPDALDDNFANVQRARDIHHTHGVSADMETDIFDAW